MIWNPDLADVVERRGQADQFGFDLGHAECLRQQRRNVTHPLGMLPRGAIPIFGGNRKPVQRVEPRLLDVTRPGSNQFFQLVGVPLLCALQAVHLQVSLHT